MALLLSKFVVTFNILGAYDGERNKTVQFDPAGVDIAAKRLQLDTDIGIWLVAWNNNNLITGVYVSSCWVEGYTISEVYAEDGVAPSFTGQENVYLEGQIQSDLFGKNEKYSTYIQSPDPQIFVGDSVNTNKIDASDPAYLAFAALYANGTGICLLSDGDSFVAPVNVRASALRSVRSGKAF